MSIYIYGCDKHPDYRPEVVHGMLENPLIACPYCQGAMHRVPQPFRFYLNPQNLLLDKMSERFGEYQKEKRYGIKRKHARGEPI